MVVLAAFLSGVLVRDQVGPDRAVSEEVGPVVVPGADPAGRTWELVVAEVDRSFCWGVGHTPAVVRLCNDMTSIARALAAAPSGAIVFREADPSVAYGVVSGGEPWVTVVSADGDEVADAVATWEGPVVGETYRLFATYVPESTPAGPLRVVPSDRPR